MMQLFKGDANKRWFLIVKIFVTLLLFGIIVYKGDWSRILQYLVRTNPWLLSIAFVGMILNVTISTLKWRILLQIHGESNEFNALHKWYFTGVFFNNFLPSSIGGDAYRVYKTMQGARSRAVPLLAVFSERLTGIIALVLFGFGATVFILYYGKDAFPELAVLANIFGGVTLVCILGIVAGRYATRWLLLQTWVPVKVKTLLEHLADYRRHPFKTLQIILLSFFFHIFTFGWMMVIVGAVGAQFDFSRLIVAVAVSNLVAVLPISINGIGLLDGSFIYVAGKLGLEYNFALAVMLMIRALLIPLSLIGGVFYLKEKKTLDIGKIKHEMTSES
jgi:uncharacterized protein (TIRG00374 family)